MSLHDWTRVPAGLFHHFHQSWSIRIADALNAGRLPKGVAALVEQRAGPRESDVLAIEARGRQQPRPGETGGGVTTERPVTRFVRRTTPQHYSRRANRSNCIHCHNIHDAEHAQALSSGKWSVEMMWKYPLPDNLGLMIDRTSGVSIREVMPDSAAAKAGVKAGEDIVRMNGQRITSIADMQWVLHNLPGTDTTLTVETSRSGRRALKLAAGWRKNDFSWRGSMWNAPPRLQVWLPELTAEQKARLGLPDGDSPLEARWINRQGKGGQQAYADGLREKDVVIALAGEPIRNMNSPQFSSHIKLHYKVGDTVPLTVLRDGKKIELKITLVE